LPGPLPAPGPLLALLRDRPRARPRAGTPEPQAPRPLTARPQAAEAPALSRRPPPWRSPRSSTSSSSFSQSPPNHVRAGIDREYAIRLCPEQFQGRRPQAILRHRDVQRSPYAVTLPAGFASRAGAVEAHSNRSAGRPRWPALARSLPTDHRRPADGRVSDRCHQSPPTGAYERYSRRRWHSRQTFAARSSHEHAKGLYVGK
jgi:hypothetical protein